jgi:SAM-dependent methyltransferase
MHPQVFAEFHKVLTRRVGDDFTGRVLEVGATPDTSTLLNSPLLRHAERIGINLAGPSEFAGFRIEAGNANDMPQFEDESFDLVITNATLEHDRFFWRTVGEMHRVLRHGAPLVVGVPGYAAADSRAARFVRRVLARLVGSTSRLDWLSRGTMTFRVHDAPHDYFRFSQSAVENVVLGGLEDVAVRPVMHPPRLIGSGVKSLAPRP